MKKLFPKIKIILGNNALETKGVKSNYFGEDLTSFLGNFPSLDIIQRTTSITAL